MLVETGREARTLLAEVIRQRAMTLDEFVVHADGVARSHGEVGTLSLRHLQRLLVARRDGRPHPVRPATARLLERALGSPAAHLLSPVGRVDGAVEERPDQEREGLRSLFASSERVDLDAVRLLADQVETVRRLDRKIGAAPLADGLRRHAGAVETLLSHALAPEVRRALALVLVDAHTLAAWQCLDLGRVIDAWDHHRRAADAAQMVGPPDVLAHAVAASAVVLADIERTADAVAVARRARALGGAARPTVQAWLAAAEGEALAANGELMSSSRAFDTAERLLPRQRDDDDQPPYIALDDTHLARWRGNAMTRARHPDALDVLIEALDHHDPDFARAEISLRADLAEAHRAVGDDAAAEHHRGRAATLASAIGSVRHARRLARRASSEPPPPC